MQNRHQYNETNAITGLIRLEGLLLLVNLINQIKSFIIKLSKRNLKLENVLNLGFFKVSVMLYKNVSSSKIMLLLFLIEDV